MSLMKFISRFIKRRAASLQSLYIERIREIWSFSKFYFQNFLINIYYRKKVNTNLLEDKICNKFSAFSFVNP